GHEKNAGDLFPQHFDPVASPAVLSDEEILLNWEKLVLLPDKRLSMKTSVPRREREGLVPVKLITACQRCKPLGRKLDHFERFRKIPLPAVLTRDSADDLRCERDPVVGIHHDSSPETSV